MEATVNERIIVLKERLNLNNLEFCTKVNISVGTMSNIQNDGNVSPKVIRSISESLSVNKDWLLHGKGKMFIELPKVEAGNAVEPWKDALVSQVKEENNRLVEQLKFYQNMVSQLMQGVKPNFRKASEYAYNKMVLPGKGAFAIGSGVKMR